MALTDEEAKQLEALQKKQSEPEPSNGGRSEGRNLNITIDLGDPDQVRRGLKLGLIERGDLDEFDDPEPESEPPEGEEPPKRRTRYE